MAKVWRITFQCHHTNGTLCEPSLHYQTDTNILEDEPSGDAVAADIAGKLASPFRLTMRTETTLDVIVAREEVLKPTIGEVGAFNVAGAGTGLAGAVTAPHALVPVIDLVTKTHSRSARGWCMLPGPCASLFTSGLGDQWDTSSGMVLAYQAFAALLDDTVAFGGIGTGHYNPVVYSRTRRQRGNTPYTFQVTSAHLNPQVRWLRRRTTSP